MVTENKWNLPMLEALLSGDTLWDIEKPLLQRKKTILKVHATLKEEHTHLIKHEPADEFHACVILGALNLVAGLLKPSGG